MASAVPVQPLNTEYRPFCFECGETSRDTTIRECAKCIVFSSCPKHREIAHRCITAPKDQGSEIKDLFLRIQQFRETYPPTEGVQLLLAEIDSEQMRVKPVIVEELSGSRTDRQTKSILGLPTAKQEGVVCVHFKTEGRSPASSAFVFMKPIESERPTTVIDGKQVPLTIRHGSNDTVQGTALWSYGECVSCGYKDDGVTACQKCDLLMHEACHAGHKAACESAIKPKAEGEGTAVNWQGIANYLCSEARDIPTGFTILHAHLDRVYWTFHTPESWAEAQEGPFAKRVTSVISGMGENLGNNLLVVVDGKDVTQQKVFVLNKVGSEYCSIM